MYKIEVRYTDNNALWKKKFYETEKQFLKWKQDHSKDIKRYGKNFAYIECYKMTLKGWQKLK